MMNNLLVNNNQLDTQFNKNTDEIAFTNTTQLQFH